MLFFFACGHNKLGCRWRSSSLPAHKLSGGQTPCFNSWAHFLPWRGGAWMVAYRGVSYSSCGWSYIFFLARHQEKSRLNTPTWEEPKECLWSLHFHPPPPLPKPAEKFLFFLITASFDWRSRSLPSRATKTTAGKSRWVSANLLKCRANFGVGPYQDGESRERRPKQVISYA